MGGDGKKEQRKGFKWEKVGKVCVCSNRQTHMLSFCTVGSSHGKILHQSPNAELLQSHGFNSQSGPGKPIQIVVSQVRGSVGTSEKKGGAGKKMHLYFLGNFPLNFCLYANYEYKEVKENLQNLKL